MGGLVSKKDDDNDSDYLRFVVLGLFLTGKTSLVHRLKTGEIYPPNNYHSLDTEGHALEDQYGFQVGAKDYGSRGSHRVFAKLACYDTVGIIYMIDSSETERITESLEFLNELLKDPKCSSNRTVMVVANKQDLDDAVGPEVIEENVKKICKIRKDITMFVMPMSTTADDDHSLQLAYRLFLKTMVRKRRNKINKQKYQPGLNLRAWETAEKMAEDSDADDGDEKGKDKEGDLDKKKKKSFFKDPIHNFKCLLIR